MQTGLEAGGLSRGSRLRTVDMTGGAVRTICDLPSNNASGTWNSEGVLLVSSQGTKGIQRVVPVTTHQGFVPGTPQPLLLLPGNSPTSSTGAYSYDVSPDGQRILVSVPPGCLGNVSAALPLAVITNWTSLLTKK